MNLGTLRLGFAMLMAALVAVVGSGCRKDADKTPQSSLVITSTLLATATQGQAYSQTLTVTGALGPVAWSLLTTGDSLPSGLSLNGATGLISGTPGGGTAGAYSLRLNVSDGFGSATALVGLAVNPPNLAILTETLPVATEGQAYTAQIQSTGGVGGSIIYSIDESTSASLPPSLQLIGATGAISGSVGAFSAGTYQISFRVSDGVNSAVKVIELQVVLAQLVMQAQALPYALAGFPYTTTLTASGGNHTYTFGIAPGSDDLLPGGISLEPTTGVISGVADAGTEGDYDVTFSVTDGLTSTIRALVFRVLPLPVTFSGGAADGATEGSAYAFTLTAVGGTEVYTWAIEPLPFQQLPTGLTLDASSGVISGTAGFDTAGNYTLRVTVTDGQTSATANVTLAVAAIDAATLLPALVAAGGGMAGGIAGPNVPLLLAAIDSRTGVALSGIGVVRSSSTGSVSSSGVTDAVGEAILLSADTPQSVTFVDSATGQVRSFLGSAQAPLREAIVCALPHGPRFSVNVSGVPAGHDMVVTLNGREILAVDGANAGGETVTVHWTSEEEMIVGADEPWLMLVHFYTDTTVGEVDRRILGTVAWIHDADGSRVSSGTPVLTLNAAAGTGTAGDGITTGIAPVATVVGTVVRPALPADIGGVAKVTYYAEHASGLHTYEHHVLAPLDVLLLPPLGTNYDYSVSMPNLSGVPGGEFTGSTRIVEVRIAANADVNAVLADPGLAPAIMHRSVAAGAPTGGLVDLSQSLPALQIVAAHLDVAVDAVTGQALTGVLGRLAASVNADVWFEGVGEAAGSGQIAVPFLAGQVGTPVAFSATYFALGEGEDAGAEWQLGGSVRNERLRAVTLSLAGEGDTGSLGAGVAVDARLSTTSLSLSVLAPFGGTTYSLSSGLLGWSGGGFEGRQGLYRMRFELPTGVGAETRQWIMEAPTGATQIAGLLTYQFGLPKLPLTVPFSAGAMSASMNAVPVSLEFVDTTATGINLLQRRASDFVVMASAAHARAMSPAMQAATLSDLVRVRHNAIADIDPVP